LASAGLGSRRYVQRTTPSLIWRAVGIPQKCRSEFQV